MKLASALAWLVSLRFILGGHEQGKEVIGFNIVDLDFVLFLPDDVKVNIAKVPGSNNIGYA